MRGSQVQVLWPAPESPAISGGIFFAPRHPGGFFYVLSRGKFCDFCPATQKINYPPPDELYILDKFHNRATLSIMTNKIVTGFFRKNFPATRCVRSQLYTLVFKTTHFCWYNCAHCCENCGPTRPREFMDADIIKGYLNAAAADAKFSGEVVFTGGEIMTAYRFATPGYVKELLNHALGLSMCVDIKTNAAWTGAAFGRQIFDDLVSVAAHNPYKLQVSLSLDNFHRNAAENNIRFITQMARRRAKITVHIAGLNGAHFVSPFDMLEQVRASGIPVDYMIKKGDTPSDMITMVNNSVLVRTGAGTLLSVGRAENIADAKYQKTPQFRFLSKDMHVLTAFDSMGNVTLGEAARRKISTRWRDGAGNPRTLGDIRENLVTAAFGAELKYKILGR